MPDEARSVTVPDEARSVTPPGEALAGEQATCPTCGEVFRAGVMIPILDGGALAYRCPACASKLGRDEAPVA